MLKTQRLKRAASDLPAPAKRAVQLLLSGADPLLIHRYRRRHGVTEPVPPIALRARVGSPAIGSYLGGHQYIPVLEEVLRPTGRGLTDFDSVLDFGCGCGRVLVPMRRRFGREISLHGCDIDEQAIHWMRRHYPELAVEVNGFKPPLPYADGTFDLLYSISVFTHLDEPGQFAWLREVRRVLRPNGVALVTIHGEHAFRSFSAGKSVGAIRRASERISRHSLADEGFVYEAAEPSRWNALRYIDGGGWGLAFHAEDYVRERWRAVFPVVDIKPRGGTQDFVLLRG